MSIINFIIALLLSVLGQAHTEPVQHEPVPHVSHHATPHANKPPLPPSHRSPHSSAAAKAGDAGDVDMDKAACLLLGECQ